MERVEIKNRLRIPTEEEQRPVRVGVVMPVLNQFQKAIEAIASISTKHDWNLYIVPQWELRWALAKGWNWGIKQAADDNCSHIIVINDDILFGEDTIDSLVYLLQSDKDVALASGVNVRDDIAPQDIKGFKRAEPVSTSEHPDFSCFMVTPESFAKIGPFDENFFPAYFEDNDYHYRIKLANLKAVATTAASYYHYGSQTQNASPEHPVVPGKQFEANRDYYKKKWGGVPGAEMFTRPFNDDSLSPFQLIPGEKR